MEEPQAPQPETRRKFPRCSSNLPGPLLFRDDEAAHPTFRLERKRNKQSAYSWKRHRSFHFYNILDHRYNLPSPERDSVHRRSSSIPKGEITLPRFPRPAEFFSELSEEPRLKLVLTGLTF